MEICCIENDVEVFGKTVDAFPLGIETAFNNLMNALPANDSRLYYGISICEDGKITYAATALETYAGEANEHKDYNVFTIEAGDYLCKTLYNWRKNTGIIKNIYEDICKDERADRSKHFIEKYIDDNKMLCLVKIKADEDVFSLIDKRAELLTKAFASADEINIAPYKKGWTPAQVINHLTKSNVSIAKAMSLEGAVTNRPPDKRVAELRQMFLDYSVKFDSPQFIWPEEGWYDKQLCIKAFSHSIETLREAASAFNLSEAITHPAFGEITKLELLHFIVVHTQRHLRQINKMITIMKKAQMSALS